MLYLDKRSSYEAETNANYSQSTQLYFSEVEQIVFSLAHMVPGIEPSPDKMLQVSQLLHVALCSTTDCILVYSVMY